MMGWCPIKLHLLACQKCQWFSYFGKILNKLPVVPCLSKEGTNLFGCLRWVLGLGWLVILKVMVRCPWSWVCVLNIVFPWWRNGICWTSWRVLHFLIFQKPVQDYNVIQISDSKNQIPLRCLPINSWKYAGACVRLKVLWHVYICQMVNWMLFLLWKIYL